MGNLFSLNPYQATQDNENIYNNIINYLNNLDDSNNTLIDTLKRLRDESYKNEIIFFKTFIPEEQQKTFFSSFFSSMNNISTYINFLCTQDKSFFSKILLGREFEEKEENFIEFLYSKELISGLSSDSQLKFSMDEIQGKKTIGSGHAITIKDFLDYVWGQLRTQAIDIWTKEYGENTEIPAEKIGELCRAMMKDLSGIKFVGEKTSTSGKTSFSSRDAEKIIKIEDLFGEYSFTIEEDIQQETLLVKHEVLSQEENKRELLDMSRAVQDERKTMKDLEELIQTIMKKALQKEGIEIDGDAIDKRFYTPIYIDKNEFKKIKFGKSTSFLTSSFLDKNSENNQFNGTFSSFISNQLKNASSKFSDAKQYWDEIVSKNTELINSINAWGQSYTSGAAVIGHVGEHFASFYLGLDATKIYGQDLNKLGQQAHVDVAYVNKQVNTTLSGFQVKNYSSVVNSFHLYDTDVSVFRKDIRRYIAHDSISGGEDIVVQLRYLSANQYLFKNTSAMENSVKKVLEMNFEYWSRYGDFQSNLGDLKNNFFILNFKMIPSSLIFQKIICELKNKKSNNKYFDLNDFPLPAPNKKDKRLEVDLSNDSAAANLAGEAGGRIIYNGFTFDLKDISSIKYIN